MEKGLLDLHSLLRWFIIIFALAVIFNSIMGVGGKKPFGKKDKRLALFLMISCDIQLLVGLFLYFVGPWGMKNISNMGGMGAVMKDKVSRFWGVEHITGMLVAIILVHIGYSAIKKDIPDSSKFKKLFWYTLLAMVIIMATIPWPFRELVGRPLFPGMQ
ncbi:MAG: hypothetical protein JST82_06435 [Bacteroidetes bacterium]|nr:hypothetical protein [Bacteroidota bacterium]